jgi:RHS repeat-associated protein
MTNATGVTQQESTYYPFGGEQRQISNTLDNRYKFAGMLRDAESGLDHTLFRKYTSNLGRWLAPDPVAGSAEEPGSLNRYTYVMNDPVNLIDPMGLFIWPEDPWGGGGGGWGGGWPGPWDPMGPCWDSWTTANFPEWCAAQGSPNDFPRGGGGGVGGGGGGGGGAGGQKGRAADQQKIDQVKQALPEALLRDPECLSFLGAKGAKPLEILARASVTPSGARYDINYGGFTYNQWEVQRSAIPVESSITIATGGYALTTGHSYSFGGGRINTGTPRAMAEVLVHELGHAGGVLLREGGSYRLTEENDRAIAEHCMKTIGSFNN